jgi:hypothetical protein
MTCEHMSQDTLPTTRKRRSKTPACSPLDKCPRHHVTQPSRCARHDADLAVHRERCEGALVVPPMPRTLDVVSRVRSLPRLPNCQSTSSPSASKQCSSTYLWVSEPHTLVHPRQRGIHLDPVLLQLGVVLPVLIVFPERLGGAGEAARRVRHGAELGHGAKDREGAGKSCEGGCWEGADGAKGAKKRHFASCPSSNTRRLGARDTDQIRGGGRIGIPQSAGLRLGLSSDTGKCMTQGNTAFNLGCGEVGLG